MYNRLQSKLILPIIMNIPYIQPCIMFVKMSHFAVIHPEKC